MSFSLFAVPVLHNGTPASPSNRGCRSRYKRGWIGRLQRMSEVVLISKHAKPKGSAGNHDPRIAQIILSGGIKQALDDKAMLYRTCEKGEGLGEDRPKSKQDTYTTHPCSPRRHPTCISSHYFCEFLLLSSRTSPPEALHQISPPHLISRSTAPVGVMAGRTSR